ncbi:MAG: pyridoxal-phosphate dependent enzyme, partial [Spirochaetia bacterium]
MPAKGLVCARCSHRYPLEQLYKCGQCGGILEVEYQYEVVAEADAQPEALDASNDRELTAWLLESFLPVEQAKRVGLGEGDTPLVSVPRLSRSVGVPRLWLKCESGNPTGSFKDHPVSIGVSKAGELGISTAVVASSGNASSSVAAFAARAGMRAVVLIPKTASAEKVAQTRRHGALVLQIDGSISTCFELSRRLSEEHGFCNLSTTFVNPYTVEGNKTISYELFMQMNREVPDVIFVRVGAGPMVEPQKLPSVNKKAREKRGHHRL